MVVVDPVLKLNDGKAGAVANVGVEVAAGVEAAVALVTVEKREEEAVPSPIEAGCVTAAAAVETALEVVDAADTTFPKLTEDEKAEVEDTGVANEKLPEEAAGVEVGVVVDAELPVPLDKEKENPVDDDVLKAGVELENPVALEALKGVDDVKDPGAAADKEAELEPAGNENPDVDKDDELELDPEPAGNENPEDDETGVNKEVELAAGAEPAEPGNENVGADWTEKGDVEATEAVFEVELEVEDPNKLENAVFVLEAGTPKVVVVEELELKPNVDVAAELELKPNVDVAAELEAKLPLVAGFDPKDVIAELEPKAVVAPTAVVAPGAVKELEPKGVVLVLVEEAFAPNGDVAVEVKPKPVVAVAEFEPNDVGVVLEAGKPNDVVVVLVVDPKIEPPPNGVVAFAVTDDAVPKELEAVDPNIEPPPNGDDDTAGEDIAAGADEPKPKEKGEVEEAEDPKSEEGCEEEELELGFEGESENENGDDEEDELVEKLKPAIGEMNV